MNNRSTVTYRDLYLLTMILITVIAAVTHHPIFMNISIFMVCVYFGLRSIQKLKLSRKWQKKTSTSNKY